jgi:hypothetical protein
VLLLVLVLLVLLRSLLERMLVRVELMIDFLNKSKETLYEKKNCESPSQSLRQKIDSLEGAPRAADLRLRARPGQVPVQTSRLQLPSIPWLLKKKKSTSMCSGGKERTPHT